MTRTVLLVEDNELNRYLATFLLEGRGLKVVSALDGPTAVRLATSMKPAIILLDIQLPLMDGYEVARTLRRAPSLDQSVIIAVTAFAMVGDRDKAVEAGFDGYIEKPVDPATFVDEVLRQAAAKTD